MHKELRVISQLELRAKAQSLLVTQRGVRFSSAWEATHVVTFVNDPHWPRAVVGLQHSGTSAGDLVRIAEAILAFTGAPTRWAFELAGFLEANASEFSPDETSKGITQFIAINQSLRRNEFSSPVWDLCTGRIIACSELHDRMEVLASLPANSGDLTLDSRFPDVEYIRCSDPFEVLEQLEGALSWTRKFKLPVLSLTYDYDSVTIWVQQSIRTWLISRSSGFPDSERLIESLTLCFSDSFEAYDRPSYERVRQRIRELCSEYDREIWQQDGNLKEVDEER